MPDRDVTPLGGCRVIDVSAFLAGPFCATQLAEFGAEVIELELPRVGDALRKFGTITPCGDSLPWLSECRNKKTATFDLRKAEGASLLKRLVAVADILVENFQPHHGEMGPRVGRTARDQSTPDHGAHLGLRTERPLSRSAWLRPHSQCIRRLVLSCRLPRPAGGDARLRDHSGLPRRPLRRVRRAAGVAGAGKTGRGQVVDIGLYEPIFRILDELAPAYALNGFVRQRMGPGTVNVVPHSHYPTKDGRWIAIACTSDKIFARLAEAMGAKELAGEGKWGTLRRREAEQDLVDAYVAAWTARHDRAELLTLCEEAQVPCGPVYSVDEIFADPQYEARDNIVRVKDDRVGEIAIPNVVPRLTDTPGGAAEAEAIREGIPPQAAADKALKRIGAILSKYPIGES
jgi:crotonobetainyl-CoA:carnitine CoA-transferase CaiB-like acyl-CoA transferase